jgi:hypothetical protein
VKALRIPATAAEQALRSRLLSSTCVLVLALASESHAADPWKIERDVTLTVPAGVAQDIRWASDTQLFVAEGRNGVTVRRADAPEKVESFAISPSEKGGFFFASRMAASPAFVAVASPLTAFSWRARAAKAPVHEPIPVGMTIDIDLSGDKLALLGGDTNHQGGTPDGILSVGTLSRNFADRSETAEVELR